MFFLSRWTVWAWMSVIPSLFCVCMLSPCVQIHSNNTWWVLSKQGELACSLDHMQSIPFFVFLCNMGPLLNNALNRALAAKQYCNTNSRSGGVTVCWRQTTVKSRFCSHNVFVTHSASVPSGLGYDDKSVYMLWMLDQGPMKSLFLPQKGLLNH